MAASKIGDYPAALGYLKPHRARLTPRERGRPDAGHGRKPGDYEWYEIQDSTSYYEVFEADKILYPDTVKGPRFALSTEVLYCGNTVYVIPSGDRGLLAILNSSVIWFVIATTFQSRDERAGKMRYRLLVQDVRNLPVPHLDRSEWREVRIRCDALTSALRAQPCAERSSIELSKLYEQLDVAVCSLYGLDQREWQLIKRAIDPEPPF